MRKALAHRFEFMNQLKFGTQLSYLTADETDWLDEENYFLSAQHLLNPGDEIRVICSLDDGGWRKAVYEVVSSIPGFVGVERITDWRAGGKQEIPGLRAVHKGFGKWNVEDERGRVIETALTKEQAQAFVTERNAPDRDAA